MNQNTKQNKREQNHKVEFFTTKKIEGDESGGQSSLFFYGLRKVNFTRDYQSNKLFKLRSNKLTRYSPRINN